MTSTPAPVPAAHTPVTAAPVLVTGGTGTLGRHVVRLLLDTGATVRVLGRTAREPRAGVEFVGADLSDPSATPAVTTAVEGVETVLHLAGSSTGDEVKARTLIDGILASGARPHIVYISVVGADTTPVVSAMDRMAFGYVAAKRAAEVVISESGLPWTTLRATQFHDLALTTFAALAKMPFVIVPGGTSMQTVETAEVAERLVELALGAPQGLVPDLAGPEVHGMDELARTYLESVGKHRPILRITMPGKAARAFRDGANLNRDRAVGRRTWADFLASRGSRQPV